VRLAIAIALSLGSNAAIWALLAARGAFSPPPTPATARPVTLAPLVGAEWDANRAVKPEPPPPPALAQRRRLPAGEVVELPPDEGQPAQPPPDDARYLSDRDRRVERETVSRYAGNYPNLLPVPQPGAPGREAAGQGGRGQRTARGAGEEGKGDRARKDAANAQEKLAAAPTSERKSVQRDEGGPEEPPSPSPGPDRMTGPTKPDLSLGPETIARIMGGPGMAGYGQAEEGAVTALNTRDGGELARYYIHAAWKIEPDWIRRVRGAAAERDPDGQLFFYKERTVVVAATLDTNGNLMEVSVVRSSNVDFFDRVAVSSIRQAQPFAPPPASMLFDGRARMAWTFTLYPPERRSSVSGRPLR
jgi:TonB family protein